LYIDNSRGIWKSRVGWSSFMLMTPMVRSMAAKAISLSRKTIPNGCAGTAMLVVLTSSDSCFGAEVAHTRTGNATTTADKLKAATTAVLIQYTMEPVIASLSFCRASPPSSTTTTTKSYTSKKVVASRRRHGRCAQANIKIEWRLVMESNAEMSSLWSCGNSSSWQLFFHSTGDMPERS
jgi:hypothetical protein